MKTIILDKTSIAARMKRIAYEIYERNYAETQLVLVGIGAMGTHIAQKLEAELAKISPLKIQRFRTEIDRSHDLGLMDMQLAIDKSQISNQVVIVIDDVLYSGRTLLSVVSQLLTDSPRVIQTLVLIDRGHRMMPISPDFVGLELSTTLQQHVSFEVNENGEESACLS